MGHDKRQDKRSKQAPFVSTPWTVLNSKAYINLPPSAAKALPYFFGRPKVSFADRQYLQTTFSFSYKEAEKLGFAPATWSKVLQDLVAFGFIEPTKKGGLRGNGKVCAVFHLSDRWKCYGQRDFVLVDFKTWGT